MISTGRPLAIVGSTVFFGKKNQLHGYSNGAFWKIVDLPTESPILKYCPRLLDRLWRNEISQCKVLDGDRLLLIYRREFFEYNLKTGELTKVFELERGSRPLGVAVDDGKVVFGEYGRLSRSESVLVYAADMYDLQFKPVFRFEANTVKHIHNVQWDKFRECYWVLTGDSDQESGIFGLSRYFEPMGWLVRGSQLFRAVKMFVCENDLIYGTDSETAENWIVRVTKENGRIEKLKSIDGSSLHCSRMGDMYMISTTVEPSQINTTRLCSIYQSVDLKSWSQRTSGLKDWWLSPHFQFGTFVLPESDNSRMVVYGGQGIKGLDGKFVIES
jgi:hypothetical protein